MPAHVFPLRKILEYRKLTYQGLLSQVSPVFSQWALLSERLVQLEGKRTILQENRKTIKNFEELIRNERFSQQISLMKSQVKVAQERLYIPYRKAKEEVLKAFRQVDLLEKLAKSSFEAYKRKMKKKEKNLLDDMLVVWYCNRGKG